MAAEALKYKRVLLKTSGDAFAQPEAGGIDAAQVASLASRLKRAVEAGVQLAVVVGGGNLVRARSLTKFGFGREASDYMGMLATVINGLALQDALGRQGVESRVLSAIQASTAAEPYIRKRATKHLQKGRVVILAGGTGSPYFTTDTAAALRAIEIGAEVLLKATKVDGVYSADPLVHKSAKKFDFLSYNDILGDRLEVMDATAVTLCMENKLPIIVFDLKQEEGILKAVQGQKVGTLVGEPEDAD